MVVIYIEHFNTMAKGGVLLIQLTVTDTLQNYTNDYIFKTLKDMTTALHLLFDFTHYTEESLHRGVLQLDVKSDKPLDTRKVYYHFSKERRDSL